MKWNRTDERKNELEKVKISEFEQASLKELLGKNAVVPVALPNENTFKVALDEFAGEPYDDAAVREQLERLEKDSQNLWDKVMQGNPDIGYIEKMVKKPAVKIANELSLEIGSSTEISDPDSVLSNGILVYDDNGTVAVVTEHSPSEYTAQTLAVNAHQYDDTELKEKIERIMGTVWAPSDVLIDPRDYKKYKTVKIGNQIWMAENLDYAGNGAIKYSDFDQLSWADVQTIFGPVGLLYSGDSFRKPSPIPAKIGRVYNWEQAMTAAPPGWHLPTEAEWIELVRFITDTPSSDSDQSIYDNIHAGSPAANTAAELLKAKSGWSSKIIPEDIGGTDAYGFAAVPGYYGENYVGSLRAAWWSSTETDSYTARAASVVNHIPPWFEFFDIGKARVLSIRLVKDDPEKRDEPDKFLHLQSDIAQVAQDVDDKIASSEAKTKFIAIDNYNGSQTVDCENRLVVTIFYRITKAHGATLSLANLKPDSTVYIYFISEFSSDYASCGVGAEIGGSGMTLYPNQIGLMVVNRLKSSVEFRSVLLKDGSGSGGIDGKDGKDGKDGINGIDGQNGINGDDGQDGADGKSAYEIAVEKGFAGTETEWLSSLKGKDGEDGKDGKDGQDATVQNVFELAPGEYSQTFPTLWDGAGIWEVYAAMFHTSAPQATGVEKYIIAPMGGSFHKQRLTNTTVDAHFKAAFVPGAMTEWRIQNAHPSAQMRVVVRRIK